MADKVEFPPRQRVIYKINPLVEVICQIRFARNLEIENKLPVDFQSRIRSDYPLFSTREQTQLMLSAGNAGRNERPFATATVYDFSSVDELWKVSLAGDFVALSTRQYVRWEDFRDRLNKILDAAIRAYQIELTTRIGLRYKNVIVRETVGQSGVPWRLLLAPHIAGLLTSDIVDEEALLGCHSTAQARVDRGAASLTCGLVRSSDAGDAAYLIDGDFFTDEKLTPEPTKILDILEHHNDTAGRFFRWCISDRLHDALQPSSV